MKTLIIHPKDKSTIFLQKIYKDIPNKTVVTGGMSKSEVHDLIDHHDRIMMMGHGAPGGLFCVDQFYDTNGYIIDPGSVFLLSEKTENIYIWCNADQFVNRHGLKGFYSGMFISEVGEAYYCGLPRTSQDIVDESNYGFCDILSECVLDKKDKIYNKVKNDYGKIAQYNPVASYNNSRLYMA